MTFISHGRTEFLDRECYRIPMGACKRLFIYSWNSLPCKEVPKNPITVFTLVMAMGV